MASRSSTSIAKNARTKVEVDFATWLMMAKLGSFDDLPSNAQKFLTNYRTRLEMMSEAESTELAVLDVQPIQVDRLRRSIEHWRFPVAGQPQPAAPQPVPPPTSGPAPKTTLPEAKSGQPMPKSGEPSLPSENTKPPVAGQPLSPQTQPKTPSAVAPSTASPPPPPANPPPPPPAAARPAPPPPPPPAARPA